MMQILRVDDCTIIIIITPNRKEVDLVIEKVVEMFA